VIFNTTFQKLSLNRAYLPFNVSKSQLKHAVQAARTLGFDGFNVTMPHKTRILELVDQLDDVAKKGGTVNTVAELGRGSSGTAQTVKEHSERSSPMDSNPVKRTYS
jgi:shikimate dehydrogenase